VLETCGNVTDGRIMRSEGVDNEIEDKMLLADNFTVSWPVNTNIKRK
jgi:hypothetical protein